MSAWGRNVVGKDMGGWRLNVFEPRPGHLADIVEASAKWGDREFLVCGGRRVSFAEFRAAVDRAARRLRTSGGERGAMAMLLGANSPEWLLVFWALAKLGTPIALGNGWWSAEELSDAIVLTSPGLVIADRVRAGRLPSGVSVLPLEAFADCWSGPGVSPTLVRPVDEEEPALLIFTSGTTSRARAAVLSHRAALACLHVLYASRDRTPSELTGEEAQLTFLSCAPLFHISGYMSHTQALLSGHRFVLMEGRSDPARILDLIESENVSMWATVPTLLSRVMTHPESAGRKLGSVIAIAAGGAVVTPDLMRQVRATFPNVALGTAATYGLTESGGSVTSIAGEDYLKRPTSSGSPLPACELRIRDPDSEGIGEVLVRTPSAMSGYWGGQGTILDAGGWIQTGDLGRLDEEGYLFITGRSKDIIIRGGENVSAPRVEAVLARHSAVAEVGVVGLEHADLGEEVAAVVVLRQGARANEAELRDFAAQSLAYFETPSRWWVRETPLPVNATSKVMKAVLRAEMSAYLAGR
jgi:long-chain acyl-CoA synthetase